MKYYKEYRLEYADCGETGHLKLPRMIDLMMETSEGQLADTLGGTAAMQERGLGWVVTQYEFEFADLPAAGQKIRIWTEAVGYNRFLSYRDFGIEDENGHQLVNARSQWVLFDLKKRRLLPSSEEIMADLKAPVLEKMPRFKRLRARDDYEDEKVYRAYYYDLDMNHHVNNSHYLDWVIDTLPRDFLNSHEPKELAIKFEKEIRYGDEVACRVKSTAGEAAASSWHAVCRQGEVMALCEVKWQKMCFNRN
ncbi:acyl-ACP thioesterase [Lactobacillus nasalidis]|uniref:Acyl-ACP thioesterase n=1 Tax=Lactobacillus nasalidis TaxID=2797258 RepID=A0ABQ3W8N4_9LACO|nr:acyl-ACP thioesterase domain-containing protein [Lactobacillus nasalidis]GHV98199.1 acyl-ACP thioesterase [Lactobacillus nasalidis]GHV98955.1 acyl-ACP thioesterase [Lactobacillus nasalidis]GHW01881.1 acyl-ACP thioesterase [Lactobacillus nasalidis]